MAESKGRYGWKTTTYATGEPRPPGDPMTGIVDGAADAVVIMWGPQMGRYGVVCRGDRWEVVAGERSPMAFSCTPPFDVLATFQTAEEAEAHAEALAASGDRAS